MMLEVAKKRKKHKSYSKSLFSPVFIIIFILTLATSSECSKVTTFKSQIKCDSENSVSKATLDIIREFFIAQNIKFDIIIYGETSNHINDITNDVTKQLNDENIPINLTNIVLIDMWNHELSQSKIFFTKTVENFHLLHKTMTRSRHVSAHLTNLRPQKLKFFIYCEEIKTLEELQEVMTNYNNFSFDTLINIRFYEFFIINNQKSVHLAANLLYSETHCNYFEQKVQNSFDKNSKKWIKKLENFDHDSNFHGCLFNILSLFSSLLYIKDHYNAMQKDPVLFQKLIASENVTYAGLFHEVIDQTAKRTNFSYHYTFWISGTEDVLLHGTRNFQPGEGKMMFFVIGNYDLSDIGPYKTLPFLKAEMYYLISLNDYYTNYEKMTKPFDFTTWMLLSVSFGLTFGTIFVLHQCPKWLRELVIGKGVQNPGYNALGIAFGISQLKVPSEIICRVILIFFIWFCLIFRTCYQSMMFEFMTTDMRKPLPASVDDLRRMHYTIVSHGQLEPILKQQINGRDEPNLLFIDRIEDFKSFYAKALNGEKKEKYAFFIGTDYHTQLNLTFKHSLPIMQNENHEIMGSLMIPQNSILARHVDDIMTQFITTGIARTADNFLYEESYIEEAEDPRKILAMSDLEYGFVLWLIACLISFCVFLYELISLWLRRRMRELIGNLVGLNEFLRLLKTQMNFYHDKW